jgi:hypothetical protein
MASQPARADPPAKSFSDDLWIGDQVDQRIGLRVRPFWTPESVGNARYEGGPSPDRRRASPCFRLPVGLGTAGKLSSVSFRRVYNRFEMVGPGRRVPRWGEMDSNTVGWMPKRTKSPVCKGSKAERPLRVESGHWPKCRLVGRLFVIMAAHNGRP